MDTTELKQAALNATPDVCVWRSSSIMPHHILKLWNTDCGQCFEGLKEKCPSCQKQVMLVGFDAWWEARKSYHP